jgi:hypothetical protein
MIEYTCQCILLFKSTIYYYLSTGLVWFMVFNGTFNNISVISWRSVLLLEEIGVHRENHRPVARHKLYHIPVMLYRVHFSWTGFELTTLVVIGTDCIGNYKSNYHTILIHWKLKLTQFWNLKTKCFGLLIKISLYFFLPQNHFLTIISL